MAIRTKTAYSILTINEEGDKQSIGFLNPSIVNTPNSFIGGSSSSGSLWISVNSALINSSYEFTSIGSGPDVKYNIYGITGGSHIFYSDISTGGNSFTPKERFKITNIGNVGINISNPSSILHIRGSGTTNTTSPFHITNSGNTSLFHVKDSGDIGIGTSLPTSKVQIYGTSTSLLNVSGSTGNLVEVINSNTGNLLEVGTLVNRPIFAVNTDGNLYFNVIGVQLSAGGSEQPIYQISPLSGNSVIFDYYLFNNSSPSTNFRMGNVSAYWANTSSIAGYKDNVYFSSGDTSNITLSVDISNNLVTLFAISTISTWGIKATARVL